MAELQFFTGTMDSGKSTLALQTNHNHAVRGRQGRIFTAHDRAGAARLSSRLGLTVAAIEVSGQFDFLAYAVGELTRGSRVDYLVCDEAQFYTAEQVDQLARVVDELGVDVFCFGILTDFRTRLFPGAARLVELADQVHRLQVETLCWCGRRGTHNARTEDGVMVTEGETVVVGDVTDPDGHDGRDEPAVAGGASSPTVATADPDDGGGRPVVGYEVLCRHHHRRRLTAARAHAAAAAEPLPFG